MSRYTSTVGSRFPLIDSMEKSSGQGVYIEDMRFSGMLYARLVRSTETSGACAQEVPETNSPTHTNRMRIQNIILLQRNVTATFGAVISHLWATGDRALLPSTQRFNNR